MTKGLYKQPILTQAWAWLLVLRKKLTYWSMREPSRATADLFSIVMAKETLLVAFALVLKNRGARTAGADGLTRDWYRTVDDVVAHVDMLHDKLRTGTYVPGAARAIGIPKGDGTTRWLHVPGLLDRVVQMALALVLDVIVEPRFSRWSFGYRRNLSPLHAVAVTERLIRETGARHVLKLDIKKFFDSCPWPVVMTQLRRHVKDHKVLGLVENLLDHVGRQQN